MPSYCYPYLYVFSSCGEVVVYTVAAVSRGKSLLSIVCHSMFLQSALYIAFEILYVYV